MLYWLLTPLADDFIFFNLFRYLTFRTGGAIMTALLISFVIAPPMIRWLKSKQGAGQPIRDDGPETHFKKAGTPTMGGLMILLSVAASTVLWADLSNDYVWLALFVMLGYPEPQFYSRPIQSYFSHGRPRTSPDRPSIYHPSSLPQSPLPSPAPLWI